MPSPELVIGGGLLLMLLLGKKGADVVIQPFPNPTDEPEPDWGEDDVMDMAPQVGDFWHWNDMFVTGKLPLIYRPGDRRLMGVYNPVKSDNYLIAVVDSSVMENGRYLVVATSAISGFPANHPQA